MAHNLSASIVDSSGGPEHIPGCNQFPYVVYCARRGVVSYHQNATEAAVARIHLLDTGYYVAAELKLLMWKNGQWEQIS